MNDLFVSFVEQQIVLAENQKSELEDNMNILSKKYENLKMLLEQKEFARTKRTKNETTVDMINVNSNSTRYQRLKETKNILEFIHGGIDGAIWGAWDFLCHQTTVEQ